MLVGCFSIFDFGGIYIVKCGDILYGIFCIIGISVCDLVCLNNIFLFYIIEVG